MYKYKDTSCNEHYMYMFNFFISNKIIKQDCLYTVFLKDKNNEQKSKNVKYIKMKNKN